MSRFAGSRFGTDYTDPASYSGKGWELDDTGAGHVRRRTPGGLMARVAGTAVLALVALVVLGHVFGFVVGVAVFLVKVAIVVGLVGLVMTAVRRFR